MDRLEEIKEIVDWRKVLPTNSPSMTMKKEDVDWLISEIENLRQVCKRLGDDKALMHRDLGKEIERLRKALEKYGGHISIIEDGSDKGICEYLKHSKNTCNCGFEQALKEE